MKENYAIQNNTYKCLDKSTIKKLSDNVLLEKTKDTYRFLKLNEIYLKNIRDDYGKQKIAQLRVQFIHHQLDLLIRECFARGLKHGLNNYY
ncbi:hypothetical protein [Ruminiclostridium cellulolyticum]|uniref:Uncharacterized protein n=1 Tax=Ruminiclostridium cellulolyticum (strain ATCC 35319 / DSM 5812 / JCM 6584 / H10) TaxID=394503 RepID=B8I181_RUMCH|nr:hypothetical protein [Ruminiclostridium cellulolyticum]ACL75679.1 hypothetical protein Ccel_1325 [Ruminiclostridium cellulolyticum H10]